MIQFELWYGKWLTTLKKKKKCDISRWIQNKYVLFCCFKFFNHISLGIPLDEKKGEDQEHEGGEILRLPWISMFPIWRGNFCWLTSPFVDMLSAVFQPQEKRAEKAVGKKFRKTRKRIALKVLFSLLTSACRLRADWPLVVQPHQWHFRIKAN